MRASTFGNSSPYCLLIWLQLAPSNLFFQPVLERQGVDTSKIHSEFMPLRTALYLGAGWKGQVGAKLTDNMGMSFQMCWPSSTSSSPYRHRQQTASEASVP